MLNIKYLYKKISFRNRRILLNAVSSLGAKGVNILVLLFSVPLAYSYLGEERYGMMMTVLSVVSMLSFADLGLGFGLQNNIPKYLESENKLLLKKAISSTFFVLILVAVVFAIIFMGLFNYISWSSFLNVKDPLAILESKPSILVFALCFLVSIPLSIIQKIQNGYQEGYFNEIWKAGGNVFGLILLLLFIYTDRGVPYMILAIYGSNTLFLLINFLSAFTFSKKLLVPKFSFINKDLFKDLFKDGVKFFIIFLLSILTLALDSLIIAQYFGAEAVASYNIGYRIVMLFTLPAFALINPMLFAYNDAIAKKDIAWITTNSRRTLSLSFLLSILFSVTLFVGINFIIEIWIGTNAIISSGLVKAFAGYIFFYNFNMFFSTIMLSSEFVDSCLIYYSIAAVISFVLKFILIEYLGIPGILWATIIGISFFFLIPSFFILKKNNYI